MTVKRITLRISPELHQQLIQLSDEHAKSLNTLAVEALESYATQFTARSEQLPLQALSNLLSPIAEAENISEEELLEYARAVRRRIWQERYEKVIRSVES